MSSGCSLINESNYAEYDAKYNISNANSKVPGSCINPDGKSYRGNGNGVTGCSQNEFACYANHTLSKQRKQLDSNLAEIYQPQNSRIATLDSNYHATMLTGVIWAMLGTTVLYYAFTKI
jgi:hypothetical protein